MQKEFQYIITIKQSEDDENKMTADNVFTVDGKEASFSDVTTDEKMTVFEALKGSLGCLANIILMEMKHENKEEK